MKLLKARNVLVLVCASTACGGAQPPPPAPTKETDKESPAASSAPAAEPEKPSAAGAEKEKSKEKEKPKVGRPIPSFNDASLPTTVGTDGALFHYADGVELRIPPGAFTGGLNVLLSVDSKSKGAGKGKIGEVYLIQLSEPDARQSTEAKPSNPRASAGDPFVLKLPLTGKTQSANLTIEATVMDPKKNKLTSHWEVTAMTKFESGQPGRAVFELMTLPDGHVHLTSQAPSAAAAPGAAAAPAAPAEPKK
ncbi:MAG TPA: hypothetical protein VGJ84_01310 [Polyangiaceae bacterium]